MKFLEEFVVVSGQRLRTDAALGDVAAQRFAARPKILNLDTVLGRPVERNLDAILVVQRNSKARAEFAQLVFVEFLLLMRDVLAFARFAQTVALNRSSEYDCRGAFVFYGRLVCGIDLARIVPPKS